MLSSSENKLTLISSNILLICLKLKQPSAEVTHEYISPKDQKLLHAATAACSLSQFRSNHHSSLVVLFLTTRLVDRSLFNTTKVGVIESSTRLIRHKPNPYPLMEINEMFNYSFKVQGEQKSKVDTLMAFMALVQHFS